MLPDKLSALHFLKLKLKNQIQKIAQIFKRLAAAPCLFYIFEEQGFTQQKIQEKFTEAFVHTLPKTLFIYLPIFASILWLFHNKKKWWYFDHGIFTLHYFSFLLISILAVTVLVSIFGRFDNLFINSLEVLVIIAAVIYSAIYFFIAHHRIYQTKKRITILKGFLIFCTNTLVC